MQTRRAAFLMLTAGAVAAASSANAQQTAPARAPAPTQIPGPYGPSVSLEQARRMIAAATLEAERNHFLMAFCVVDPAGELVMLERMEGVQYASIGIAQTKARCAARFRRPTRYWEEALAGGRMAILGIEGVIPSEGGLPIVDREGHVIGAIGASGGSAQQDGQCAEAGLRAFR